MSANLHPVIAWTFKRERGATGLVPGAPTTIGALDCQTENITDERGKSVAVGMEGKHERLALKLWTFDRSTVVKQGDKATGTFNGVAETLIVQVASDPPVSASLPRPILVTDVVNPTVRQ